MLKVGHHDRSTYLYDYFLSGNTTCIDVTERQNGCSSFPDAENHADNKKANINQLSNVQHQIDELLEREKLQLVEFKCGEMSLLQCISDNNEQIETLQQRLAQSETERCEIANNKDVLSQQLNQVKANIDEQHAEKFAQQFEWSEREGGMLEELERCKQNEESLKKQLLAATEAENELRMELENMQSCFSVMLDYAKSGKRFFAEFRNLCVLKFFAKVHLAAI